MPKLEVPLTEEGELDEASLEDCISSADLCKDKDESIVTKENNRTGQFVCFPDGMHFVGQAFKMVADLYIHLKCETLKVGLIVNGQRHSTC